MYIESLTKLSWWYFSILAGKLQKVSKFLFALRTHPEESVSWIRPPCQTLQSLRSPFCFAWQRWQWLLQSHNQTFCSLLEDLQGASSFYSLQDRPPCCPWMLFLYNNFFHASRVVNKRAFGAKPSRRPMGNNALKLPNLCPPPVGVKQSFINVTDNSSR